MYVIATNNNPYTAVFEQQNMDLQGRRHLLPLREIVH